MIKAPRGTKDITPDVIHKWHKMEEVIQGVCDSFGFREIRVPVFEHTELFERGVGGTSDVVQKEMYTFLDKGNRSISLRPEVTASVVRAYLENGMPSAPSPTKLYYMDSCYRYEKPGSGRMREFHQFGVECIGAKDPCADAEVISLVMMVLAKIGVKELKLKINSIGCPKCRSAYNEKLIEFFKAREDELCGTCKERLVKNPMRIIDCKVEHCKQIGEEAPKILDYQCDECAAHFEKVKAYLEGMGIDYIIDDTIVRGLDYYTKTVFEVKSEGMVVCGGGRYDGLVEELGGNSTPSMGFAIGLERLLMILEMQNVEFELPSLSDLFVVSIGEKADMYAQKLVYDLRKKGVKAQKDIMGRSMKAQMKFADKIGAKYVVVIGDDEVESQVINLKNMQNGEVQEISIANLMEKNF